MSRPFRFGITLLSGTSRAEWQAKSRQAEELGYDLLLPDHLGMPAPFSALVAAGEITSSIRLGTMVLNTGFSNPALLAREVATTDQLVDGRLEIGLGAGWARDEHEAAGLPFPSPGRRVEHLKHTTKELRRLLSDPEHHPRPAQLPTPPIMLAGKGDRLLRLAAQHADIVGLAGVTPAWQAAAPGRAGLTERIRFLREAAGNRPLELNLMIVTVAITQGSEPDLSLARQFWPDLSDVEMLQLPGVLAGTEREIADTLRDYRENHGLTYFTLSEPSMHDFAKVLDHLR